MATGAFPATLERHGFRRCPATGTIEAPDLRDLSLWFDPFLPTFARETLRSGGVVWRRPESNGAAAITFWDPTEATASVFSADRSLVGAVVTGRGTTSVFGEFDLEPVREEFDIFSVDLAEGRPAARYRHAVRLVLPAEVPEAARLMREVLGGADERWFTAPGGAADRCLAVELDGTLAGAGWVSVVGAHARLHSLAVRPRFRGLGVGGDLVRGRLDWAAAMGARRAISEISENNSASRAAARASGMRPVGRIYLYAGSRS
jgi:GNAT superfamily N-acetyltransferase